MATETAISRYAGSLGPLPLDPRRHASLTRIGEVLAREFDLRGLFGVDFIDDGAEPWPIEVNPRYTASIEVLERALSFSAVGWHVAACRVGRCFWARRCRASRAGPQNGCFTPSMTSW